MGVGIFGGYSFVWQRSRQWAKWIVKHKYFGMIVNSLENLTSKGLPQMQKQYFIAILVVIFYTQTIKSQEFIENFYYKALIDLKYQYIIQNNYKIDSLNEQYDESYLHTFRTIRRKGKATIHWVSKNSIIEDYLSNMRKYDYRDTIINVIGDFFKATECYDSNANLFCKITCFTEQCKDSIIDYYDKQHNITKSIRTYYNNFQRVHNGRHYLIDRTISDYTYNQDGQRIEENTIYFTKSNEVVENTKELYTYMENGLPKTTMLLIMEHGKNSWIYYYKNECSYK